MPILQATRRALTLTLAIAALAASGAVHAQAYPTKPVRIINNFPPGGPADILARSLAEALQQSLKQTVVVENKPGAGGNLGADAVAKADPDGYTVLVGIDTTFTINPSIYKTMPFKPADLKPVMILASSGLLLGVNPATQMKTVPDFIARGRSSGLTLSSGSNGSPGHLAAALLMDKAKLKVTHVPYKGNAPAVTATLSGEVDGGVLATPGMLPHVKAGKVTALAVTSRQRSPLAPEVPTAAEAGLKDLTLEVFYVAMVPAATPPEVVAALQAGMSQALARPDLRARLTALDMVIEEEVGPAAVQRLQGLRQQYAPVIKAAGMQVD